METLNAEGFNPFQPSKPRWKIQPENCEMGILIRYPTFYVTEKIHYCLEVNCVKEFSFKNHP